MLRRLAILLCLAAACHAKEPRPAADIPIPTSDQKKIRLKQYRGKVVILVLISTTCDDCIKTLAILNKMQKDFGPRGLQMIGAAINDNAAYSIGPFVQRYRPSFPMGSLGREDAIKMADIPPNTRPFVPVVLFIDRQGTVRLQYYGNDPVLKEQEKALRAIADSLLKF
jgi:peroxiredoxin